MKVSVYCPVKNGGRFFPHAIKSVLAQTLTDFELVVVDGDSSDGTMKALERIEAEDSRVRHITDAQGYIHGINAGLDACGGEYVGRIDADDAYHPDKLRLQVEAMDAHRETAVCWTDGWQMDDQDKTKATYWECNWLVPGERGEVSSIFRSLLRRNFVIHGCALIRRSMLGSERYDPLTPISEDWDLWLRLAKKHSFIHVDRPLYGYRLHDSSRMSQLIGMNVYHSLFLPNRWLRLFPDISIKDKLTLGLMSYTLPVVSLGAAILHGYRPDLINKINRMTQDVSV